MFEAIGAIITAVLRERVQIYVAALIASALLLFLPYTPAQQIGITEFRELWRGYIGIIFIASIALLASEGIYQASTAIYQYVGNKMGDWCLQRSSLEKLRMLTRDEKIFLRHFIIDGVNTIKAKLDCGVAGGLVKKNIIYRSSDMSDILHRFSYNLQHLARKILSENQNLLDL